MTFLKSTQEETNGAFGMKPHLKGGFTGMSIVNEYPIRGFLQSEEDDFRFSFPKAMGDRRC